MILQNKKTLNILGQRFLLQLVPDEHAGDLNLGRCDTKNAVIKVKKSMPFGTIEVTVWHEVIHALSDLLSLDLEERQVTALASGLYQVYTSNCAVPDMISQKRDDGIFKMSFDELSEELLKFKAKSEYQQASIVILRRIFSEAQKKENIIKKLEA